jgi:hypothetical protein
MTPKDAGTCADFWKEIRALTEIVHTRGADGLLDLLMEDFAGLPAAEQSLVEKQLGSLLTLLPFLKQAKAACITGPPLANQKIPYRD